MGVTVTDDRGHHVAARSFGPITYEAVALSDASRATHKAHMTYADAFTPTTTPTQPKPPDRMDTPAGAEPPPETAECPPCPSCGHEQTADLGTEQTSREHVRACLPCGNEFREAIPDQANRPRRDRTTAKFHVTSGAIPQPSQ